MASFSVANGSGPVYGPLIEGTDGNYYGTTYGGGAYDLGTIFRQTPAGGLMTLHSFSGTDGANPQAGLIQAADGNLYGTTELGGAGSCNCGTIFKITPDGTLTTLHSFRGSDGANPYAGLVQATGGMFYGTTVQGGAASCNCGTIFSITATGEFMTLHSFDGIDGKQPYGGLIQAMDGKLYGTTYLGGAGCGCGTIFSITVTGTLTTVHSFNIYDGDNPRAGLIQGTNGYLYGTTQFGGSGGMAGCNCGTIFSMTPAGVLATLHSFSITDGANPYSGLMLGTDGNFYGTTANGGLDGLSGCNCGTVFKITPLRAFTMLHSFNVTDGGNPEGGLMEGSDGNVYGTTSYGASNGHGNVFKIATGLGPATILVTGATSFFQSNSDPAVSSSLTVMTSNNSAKSFSVVMTPAVKWLSLSPSSGVTPGNLTLTVNPAKLIPGTYETVLTISVPGTANGSLPVPVMLMVTGPILTASPSLLSFAYQPGAPIPAAQSLAVTSQSGSAVPLATTTANVTWVVVSQAASAPATVQVAVNPALLAPGNYQGQIFFTAIGSPGPSLTVTVSVTVGPLPVLTLSAPSLAFTAETGAEVPAQSLGISTGAVPLAFGVTPSVSWLSVSPGNGLTPANVLVTAHTAGLGPGTYNGSLTVESYGAASSPTTILVTLTVTGPHITATPANLLFMAPMGGPAPASQTVAVAAGSSALSFTAKSSAPWLSVTPVAGTTPAELTVSVNPAGMQDGTFTGAVTLLLTDGSSVPVPVTLKVGAAVPRVLVVTNAASGAGGSVSPGLLVTIYGTGLGPSTGVSAIMPLPGGNLATSLGGTQVLFDGIAAPLLYSSDQQVNAVVPLETAGKASTSMTVTYGGNTSAATTLQMAVTAPGLFTTDGSGRGAGAIINQDSTANSASNPAPAGTIVSLYGTGGGQTVEPFTDGEIARGGPNNLVQTTTATVGGQTATVQYAGWAPDLVTGVMQINVTIPTGTPSGPAPVVIQVGTAQSQTVTLFVK